MEKIKKYFAITELVSKAVAAKYGEQAWSFFDPRLFDVLVWIREGLGLGLVVNTPTQQQRGFRENTCALVADKTKKGQTYASAHVLGKGVDFNIAGNKMTAAQVRSWIQQHANECPYPVRLEDGVTWVHIDVCNISGSKVQLFRV